MKLKLVVCVPLVFMAQSAASGDLIHLGEWREPVSLFDLTYTIVDTGQDGCYDETTEMTCPVEGQAFRGQDAQYLGSQMRYVDNGDGTVSDKVSGLMWRQSADLDGDGDIDVGDKLSYDEAHDQWLNHDFAGFHDWRLRPGHGLHERQMA